MNRSSHRYYLYRGSSMWPCFQEGDLLEAVPVALEEVRIGDCLVFRDNDGGHLVHRVVGLRDGLQTRGDAMARVDRFDAAPPELLGRVIRRHRHGQGTGVARGWAGRIAGGLYRYAGRIDPERPGRGGKLARGLRLLCSPLMRPAIRLGNVQALSLPEQAEVLVWGFCGIAMAKSRDAADKWQVSWPWRIIVTLPTKKL